MSGVVWRAYHREQKVDVAIKLITSTAAQEASCQAAMLREVQAVAGLEHPGIVRLFDFGTVPAETERASQGRVKAGTPYVAMEYAAGGDLRAAGTPPDWGVVRRVAIEILDALAHAHARGVIHRDLKPANVLHVVSASGGSRVALADFGIAHSVDFEAREASEHENGDDELESVCGTPAYMAPEQIMGAWREFGPWTDLYALGCMVYAVCCGKAPFGSGPLFLLATRHMRDPIPELEPLFSVPVGVSVWLEKMLAKRPWERFQCAADARWALTEIDESAWMEPTGLGVDEGGPAPVSDPSRPIIQTQPSISRVIRDEWPTAIDALPVSTQGRPLGKVDPKLLWDDVLPSNPSTAEFPQSAVVAADLSSRLFAVPSTGGHQAVADWPDWRSAADEDGRDTLPGIGLGLFGLREIPFVGREDERDVLWSALHRVWRARTPEVVVVRGPAGCGKTRLVRWIAQRAEALGLSSVASGGHSHVRGSLDGLALALESLYRCSRLDRFGCSDRVETMQSLGRAPGLNATDPHALAAIMRPAEAPVLGAPRVDFETPRQRNNAIIRGLRPFTGGRPLVLWLDDAQWGLSALVFATYLLDTADAAGMPVMIVLNVREEAMPEEGPEADQLRRLESHPKACTLWLDTFSADEHRALISSMLRLHPRTAQHIAERTEGNPLFAVQLVDDWVRKGMLEPGPDGFNLKEEGLVGLPDDLYALWKARVDELLREAGAPKLLLLVLSIASALGRRIDKREWREVCSRMGVAISDSQYDKLIDDLVNRRLAIRHEDGWEFAHGLICESLTVTASALDTWPRIHKAIADGLGNLYGTISPDNLERRAIYLLEAETLDEAVECLTLAADGYVDHGRYDDAIRALDVADDATMLLDEDEAYPAAVRLGRIRIRMHRRHGAPARLKELATDWLARATEAGDGTMRALALETLGHANYLLGGDLAHSIAYAEEAVSWLQEHGTPEDLADALRAVGNFYLQGGSLDYAESILAQALAVGFDDDLLEATLLEDQASLALRRKQFDQGRILLEQAIAILRRRGTRVGLDTTLCELATAYIGLGEHDAARVCLERASSIADELGLFTAGLPRVNLAHIEIQEGNYADAKQIALEVLQGWSPEQPPSLRGFAHSLLKVCAAAEMDGPLFDQHAKAFNNIMLDKGITSPETAWHAERAGDLFEEDGDLYRSRASYESAHIQWSALEMQEESGRVASRLASLMGRF